MGLVGARYLVKTVRITDALRFGMRFGMRTEKHL